MNEEVKEKLVEFAKWAIMEHRAYMCDLDGGSIQDKLVDLGLLVQVRVERPCGENCFCADMTDEWPTTCLRLIDMEEGQG